MDGRGRQRGAVRSAGALLALSVLLFSVAANGIEAPEYAVKAAFLYNFAKFVDWPPSAFAGPGAPLQICVIGTNPFGSYLSEATRGKQVNGRQVTVRSEVPIEEAGACQVVFVAPSESGRLGQVLSQLADKPVLTVGDATGFAAHGGVIGLSMQASHVRFEINMVAARRANLKLSSQLLKVATQVIGQLDEGR